MSHRRGRELAMTAFAVLTLFLTGLAAQAEEAAKRVLTLGGDITEIVYSLGEEKRLVGRDSTSTFPPEAEDLPDVGYFRQLGAEGVLSLQPDLILASASSGPPEVLKQIEATGVKVIRLPETDTPEGLLNKVERIAGALGREEKGKALRETLSKQIESARSAIAAMKGEPKVLFIMASGGGSPLVAGRETSADALIELAGGKNIFASHEGYKPVSMEAAAAAAPDAIAMMEHTLKSMGGPASITASPALKLTPAAKTKRIVARNGSYLLSFGPRLPKVMVDFAEAIRGDGQK